MGLTLSRLDLDGTNSPLGFVGKIFAAEPQLGLHVPVEQIAERLDIIGIEPLTTDGFLGGLLTTGARKNGIILVKEGLGAGRRRFTIAHELGHFLITTHKPTVEGQFLCDKSAFASWNPKEQRAALRMEAEANRFAAALLMPPTHVRKLIDQEKYASLSAVLQLADKCEVSKEAASRCFVEYCAENVAILITKNGHLIRSYRGRSFPRLSLTRGDRLPDASYYWASRNGARLTDVERTSGEYWLDLGFGEEPPMMFEQVHLQANSFATILLKLRASDREERDEMENLTSKERYARRVEMWQR